MNWRTAILGLFALYCAAGFTYSWIKLGLTAEASGARIWAWVSVSCIALAIINEWVVRRRSQSSAPEANSKTKP